MSDSGAYVVQYPNSNTNPTGLYRVVHSREWEHYLNGASPVLAIAGSFGTYEAARDRRDRLNQLDRDGD